MNLPLTVTIFESIYLLYMYFVFKTKYAFSSALFDTHVQSLGSMFVHNTGVYENKICTFGKIVAVVAIGLAFLRVYAIQKKFSRDLILFYTLIFDVVCISLAFVMNINAFVYILPLILGEIYILSTLKN